MYEHVAGIIAIRQGKREGEYIPKVVSLCVYMIPENHTTCAQCGKEAENAPRLIFFVATCLSSPGVGSA